jgi:hypothetical protein
LEDYQREARERGEGSKRMCLWIARSRGDGSEMTSSGIYRVPYRQAAATRKVLPLHAAIRSERR